MTDTDTGSYEDFDKSLEVDPNANVSSDIDESMLTVTRRRQLQIPTDKSKFETWIDHGSIVDSENYPTYPNGETVFVLKPTDKVTNFRHIAWTYSMKTDKNGNWTIRRYTCLGVMECSSSCGFAGSPPTGRHKLEDLLAR